MKKSCCRIANAYIQSGRISNPTERSEEPNLFELDRTRGLSNEIQQEDEV